MASSSDSWTTLVGDEQIGGQEYHELKFEILENDSGGYDSKVTALRLMARAAAVKLPAAVNHSPPRVVRSLCRLLCAAPERASVLTQELNKKRAMKRPKFEKYCIFVGPNRGL